MQTGKTSHKQGFSLIELMVVVATIAIPILAVGILAAGGSKSFQQTYDSIHKPIKEDALAILTTFGTIGRKSNRSNYKVYRISNGVYTEAQPLPNQETTYGQAVEFRYWDDPFDPANPGAETLEVSNTGTHYVLFYLDGEALKADFGTVSGNTAAILNGSRTTANLDTTQVLTQQVDLTEGTDLFTHDVIGGSGAGCVRLKMTLTDGEDESVEIKTSVQLRMNWPR